MISGNSRQLVLGRDSWLLMDRGGELTPPWERLTQLQMLTMLKLRKYMLSNRIQREGQAEEGGVNIIKEVYSCF